MITRATGDRKIAVQNTSRTRRTTGAYSDTARIYKVSPPRPYFCRDIVAP